MCGIALLIDPGIENKNGQSLCRVAVRKMRHRGPDDRGYHFRRPVFMGHCRLGVIDPGGSKQPMADPSGRFVLVYNGTTYNFKSLRRVLSSRWNFRSAGDTEVVLAGLVLEGPNFLKKMVGMWAGALWDHRLRKLLLFRDRMGQKPLYYLQYGKTLAAASELKALQDLAGSNWQPDTHSMADFFRYGFCLPGTTFYKNIKEVLPGHQVVWSLGLAPVRHSYWSLASKRYGAGKEFKAAGLRQRLIEAVIERLVADVPVGLMLSGGVDSSLLAAVCSASSRPLTAFTLGFKDRDFDERSFASKVAGRYCSRHVKTVFPAGFGPGDAVKRLDSLGQPFGDPSILAFSCLAETAAVHVKAVLCGDGADELFGGYQRYRAGIFLRWYSRLPAKIRQNIGRMIRKLPEPMAHHSKSLLKQAHLFQDMAENNGTGQPYVAPRLFSEKQLKRLMPDLHRYGHQPPFIRQVYTGCHDLEQMMLADQLIYLPQDILCKSDRAAMAWGLEVRAPFLDHRLVELVLNVPATVHVGIRARKQVLAEACRKMLPAWVWQRKKHGFCLPLHRWFSVGEFGRDLADKEPGCFGPLNRRYVLNILSEHRAGIRDRSLQLWAIWVFLSWIHNGPRVFSGCDSNCN